MKQKLRRFMAGFLAILTMFTALFTNGTTAFAASSSANIAFWVASSKDHGVISEFNSKHTGSILYAMIDGHSAYCMNFGLSAKGGQLMNSDSNPNTNLSAAQEKLLAYCMYYGYSTTEAKAPTNDQCNKYIARLSIMERTSDGDIAYAIGHMSETFPIGTVGNCMLAGHNGSRNGVLFTNLNQLVARDKNSNYCNLI